MNTIKPNILSKIGIVSSLRKIVPIETLKLLYNAIDKHILTILILYMTLHLKLI